MLPALLLVAAGFLLLPLVVGLAITVVGSQVVLLVRALRSRPAVIVGRVALAVLFVAFLPGAVLDLRDVVVRPRAPPCPQAPPSPPISTAGPRQPSSPTIMATAFCTRRALVSSRLADWIHSTYSLRWV